MKTKIALPILSALLLFASGLMAQHIEILQQDKPTSIRGLSVVDDSTAWISGSRGNIAKTTDGGNTWKWQQVKGFEKADFRGIEAFSAKEAVIMSSGTPALILKTTDGGNTWTEKYRNADTSYFFDAIAFETPKHGFVLGDPINNKFVLMETKDGGETWAMFKNRPDAFPGEAAFAASGTCLRVDKNEVVIVTGGSQARQLDYVIKSNLWDYWALPITHGKASCGAFSFAKADDHSSKIYIGGDYSSDHKTDSVASYIKYVDNSINTPIRSPSGFQSCVEYLKDQTFLSTGTPGSNITVDGGKTWAKIDDVSYNVCRKAKKGKLILLAGDRGKIAIFKP